MADGTQIAGVVPVLVTPFDEQEEIVYGEIERQVEAAVAFGAAAVCLPAYGSEFYKLTESERLEVVRSAVSASGGRIPVMGQSNHPSAGHAAQLAQQNQRAGVDAVSFALPRLFAIPDADLLSYCDRVCSATDLPVMVQDFNPGGVTVGPEFCQRLLEIAPNFRYAKLEEPLLGLKLRGIREATSGRVSVFEGWGGMYLPDLFDSGISGVVPGLGHADVMNRIWELGSGGDLNGALDVFDGLLPQIVFSLQNMELFLAIEKQLLGMRGIIQHTRVRSLTLSPDVQTFTHGTRLNERVLRLVERLGFEVQPLM